jgi:hypothetical protein
MSNSNMNSGDQVRCQCQSALVAVLVISTKAGQNQGRQFYTCPKVSAKCKFFQWMDESTDFSNGQSRSNVAQRGHYSSVFPNQPSSSKAPTAANSTCYSCGEVKGFKISPDITLLFVQINRAAQRPQQPLIVLVIHVER